MTFHSRSPEDSLRVYAVDARRGLTAQQVEQQQAQYGENRLREKKRKSLLRRFLDQFKDVMILILLLAAGISFVIACMEQDPGEFFEPALILLIVVLNAIMGVYHEEA